jgi:hypothetical protein
MDSVFCAAIIAGIVGFFVGITLAECHFKYLIRRQQDQIKNQCLNRHYDESTTKYAYAAHNLNEIKESL